MKIVPQVPKIVGKESWISKKVPKVAEEAKKEETGPKPKATAKDSSVKQMSIMAFVKKKKDAELATRVSGVLQSAPAAPMAEDRKAIVKDNNQTKKEKSLNDLDEERKKKELIERMKQKTIKKPKSHHADQDKDSSNATPKKKDKETGISGKKPKSKEKRKSQEEGHAKEKNEEEKKKKEVIETGPEVEKTPKKLKKWKDHDDDQESPAKKNLLRALNSTTETDSSTKADKTTKQDKKATEESKTSPSKCNVASAGPVGDRKSPEAKETGKDEASKLDEPVKKADADFENMGYVSGDDTSRYSDDHFKVVKSVKAPKGVEDEQSTTTEASVVQSPKKNKAEAEVVSEAAKSPPVVLLSRNVAEIQPIETDEPSKGVMVPEAAKKDGASEAPSTASAPASDKPEFSPSVQDELNALKPVGGQEASKAVTNTNLGPDSCQMSTEPSMTNVSSCMMEQQSMNQAALSGNAAMNVTGFNPQPNKSAMPDAPSQTNLMSSHQQQEMGPSMGVYTPDSATNSVHSIHGSYGNPGEMTEGSVANIMESPNSISSVDMNNANNSNHNNTGSSMDTSHLSQPQQQPQYDPMASSQAQSHHHQAQLQSPHMPQAAATQQSPHHPPSLPSQSPHSNHNMTSPHPQPSPHGATSNHSQQTSPHPMTIPPAANSPYATVPHPSPGSTPGVNPAPPQAKAVAQSPAPTKSPQHHSQQAMASQHLHNMSRQFYPNYGHYPPHGNYQTIPPHMFPPAPFSAHNMALPGVPGQKRGVDHHGQLPATTQPQAYYPNHGAHANQAAAARHHAGSLAKLQQLTNGLDIPPLPHGASHAGLPSPSAVSRSGSSSSKQAGAALSSRNTPILPGVPSPYSPYPTHQPPNSRMMPPGRQASASAAAANFMQHYGHNPAMLNNYYAAMNNFPAANFMQHYADHQRTHAGTPHPQGANPHHHMYPTAGYPTGYFPR